ncbi:RcnB family protein [Sphingomonas sp. JC676]|uniref:RcnB family protein n=1 Tax=Sphingomonas sp. JC676 TaxID=2768065 RepID=UPI001657AC67|nr:RcnB family protein [Sphingomonas sp. JC676]MBC9033538.1 RcnB family protein [Sphingomonas sp. JC676]
MRKLWIAAATVLAGLSLATPAAAQRVWQNGRWVVMPHSQNRPQMQPRANRWGPVVNGRWDAGNRAPGGWSSYRRPVRGWTLPGYWRDSRFRVNDYLNFGLSAPPRGYYWVRYYDDAVLVDDGGRVWDSTGGIGWGTSAEASYGDSYAYAESSSSGSAGADYPPPPRRPIESVDPNAYYREPGAYLAPEPGYDAEPIPAPYPSYPEGGYAPPVVQGPPAVQVQTVRAPGYGYGMQGGYGVTTYSSGGYAYGGGATTTVVVIPAVATTTTTTTETYTTTYVSKARRVVRRAAVRKWRPKPKCCVCVCR